MCVIYSYSIHINYGFTDVAIIVMAARNKSEEWSVSKTADENIKSIAIKVIQLYTLQLCSYMYMAVTVMYLSRRAVVSREAKKKQQASAYSGQCDHYSELFTPMVGLNFKMLQLSRYYSYRLVYYRPSTSCYVELIAERSIKSALPFLGTSQFALVSATTANSRLTDAIIFNLT